MKKITAVLTCVHCQKPQEVVMTSEQLDKVKNWRETGEHVQDILPNHSKSERELFITGICPNCWSELFNE